MPIGALVSLLIAIQATLLSTDVSLQKGQVWSHDFVLAPGDSVTVSATFVRSLASSWGCLAGIGDMFSQKGDDVGRLTLTEWQGAELTAALRQLRPTLTWFSERGGAYSVEVANSSGHRVNIYTVSISRTATRPKYSEFDPSFRTDTTYDTTWVDEPVYRTQVDTVVEQRKWTDTLYDLVPVGLKQGVTTLYRGIIGSNRSEVNFQVPDSCTGVVGFALFTDQERLRRLQADAREKAQSVSSIAKTIPNPYAAAAGIALDLVSGVTNSGDGAFTYYIVDQVGRAQYDAEQPFYFIDKGENTSDALFKVTLEPGKLYYLKLVNASILDKSVVAYQVAATTKKPRYVKHSEEVPEVRRRKIKTGTRRVPRVEERVAPHLPWKADK